MSHMQEDAMGLSGQQQQEQGRRAGGGVGLGCLALLCLAGSAASAQEYFPPSTENPPVMLQWFECRWPDMERRMSDWFMAGYGSVWLPPVSRGRANPGTNSSSAGYDVFDRFNLGKPGEQTAYGTEAYFDQMVSTFHRANGLVYVDMVLNHNAGRDASLGFQQAGGYPGFWMGPVSSTDPKQPADNWGDFHNGLTTGYYQSENPNGARYCLLKGDLVALVDIDHATNNSYIRQPTVAGNPLNIPAGTVWNLPDANNARFYPDQALGTTSVSNPGMSFAGALNTGNFASPCDVPARNEPANTLNFGKFNTVNPLAGDPTPENATGYLMRWTQWMLDVKKVDGFRIDAIKHMPSWFYDTFYDSVVYRRRVTPDGRTVTPYSFGESVEGNDFTFDRYIRKPNGRPSGRSVAGDAFGNRDALDLNGAGNLRNLVGSAGTGSWNGVFGAHLDSTDDGYQNGTVGVNHIFSHDNGSTGNGSSYPATPTSKQQGWFAHAYLIMRTGQAKLFHNARGVVRTGGFYPRAGLVPAMGVDPNTNVLNPVITNLVQLSNWLGRGELQPRWVDDDLMIFERRSPLGGGAYSGNCIVACNDRYDGGYDQRVIATSFPAGTRLVEMTGNASSATVDPNGDISDVLVVDGSGNVTIRTPRNLSATGTEHNRGFVVYAPAIPSGVLALSSISGSLPAETFSTVSWARRTFAVPVITSNTFRITLTTTNGDSGAANNVNADDNAVFRLNQGYQDWNGNGITDINYQNDVVPGYEQFVTRREPLAGTTSTNGIYEQDINAANLPEGMNYLSVVAFRKRAVNDAPLFREFRQAFYVDRLAPNADVTTLGPLPVGTTSFTFLAKAMDETVTRLHLILNPSPAVLSDPVAASTAANRMTQQDRFDYSRSVLGLVPGANTVLLVGFEESGRSVVKTYTVYVGEPPRTCDSLDFNGDGNIDPTDVDAYFSVLGEGPCLGGSSCGDLDFNNDGNIDPTDVDAYFSILGEGPCL